MPTITTNELCARVQRMRRALYVHLNATQDESSIWPVYRGGTKPENAWTLKLSMPNGDPIETEGPTVDDVLALAIDQLRVRIGAVAQRSADALDALNVALEY